MFRKAAQAGARLFPSSTRRRIEDAIECARRMTAFAAPIPVAIRLAFFPRLRILFYPRQPTWHQALYKVCAVEGYRIVTASAEPWDVAMHFAPEGEPCTLPADKLVLNRSCTDISKRRVGRVFEQVFGYPLAVDPLTTAGPILEKSNRNYTHDGRILEGPLAPADVHPDRVYQRLVNAVEDGYAVDLRVPLYGGRAPLVYRKLRPLDDRFKTVASGEIVTPDSVLSCEEQALLATFADAMGLDYGELDVLRDRTDGRIYVVDVNNKPAGPSQALSPEDARRALGIIADAFSTYLRARLAAGH